MKNANALPKSLHTVRILVNVAALAPKSWTSDVSRVLWAADVIGYPSASKQDELIQSAAAKLAVTKKAAA